MAQVETVNIKSEGGYTTINKSDFNPTRDELFLKENEIIVKPLNVENADPFIIDEKDYDEKSYEKVNATKKNLEIVAEQTDRQTLTEQVEESGTLDEAGSIVAGQSESNVSEVNSTASPKSSAKPTDVKTPTRQTPQTQLKRNQNTKK